MKILIKMVCTLAAAGLLVATPAFAGSFTTDFSSVTGFTLSGIPDPYLAYLTNNLGPTLPTDRVVLTPNVAGLQGGITMDDLDAGAAIESFTATFKMQIGPGTATPADGICFNFGPNVTPQAYGEEGPGGAALSVVFDTYVNADVGEVTPTLDVKYQGAYIASHAFTAADMVTSQLEDVSIQLTRAGKVSVVYKGQVIHTNVFVPGWGPTFGLFNISGRAGGLSEENDIANLSITTVLQGAEVAPTILTPPANATVNEGGSTNFTVSVDGTAPFTFQWTDNNVDIAGVPGVTGETTPTLTMTAIPFTENNHQIRVKVTTGANTVTSAAAILTVVRDITPPTVLKVNADVSGTMVTVVYSEPVNDTAQDSANYGIDQGVIINSVGRLDASRVVLNLATPMPGGLSYTLSIHGVQDVATLPNTIAPTQVPFRTSIFQVGAVVHKKYGFPADNYDPNTLFSDPRYPNNPDRQEIKAAFEYPADGGYRDNVADPNGNLANPGQTPNSILYYDTLQCFFIPPTTNDYVFFVTGADFNRLYLSTDADPANKHMIAQVNGWTNPRDWMIPQYDTGNPNDAPDLRTNGLRSDFNGTYGTAFTTEWPNTDPVTGNAIIRLDAGQRYYMEAVHFRYTYSGADDFAATWTYTNAPVPVAGSAPLLAGSVIGTYLDPTGASVAFTQQPADVTILQGRRATFSAAATGQSLYGTNVVYQWQTAPSGSTTFTNIPGETKASYTTPVLGVADSGRQYKLLATVPGFTVASSVAKVTVNADTVAPSIVAVAALPSQSGTTFDVGVTFDEPLDATSAGTVGNYSISAGTISGVKFYATSPGAVLTVSGLTAGTAYSVTVTGVADPYGNAITSANMPGTYSSMHWNVVGGDELQLGNGVVAVGPNAFDIYSDGIGEWAAYDEATFVYEQVAGDFDKELRVEYVDPASQWARAGLIVRDVPNFGVNRTAQEGGQAGRYQKVHVQPVVTAMGTGGANDYEVNRRLDTGGQTDGPGGGGTPNYPNAWCRLQRVGQTFTKFRSDDGVNWVNIGVTTWGVDDVSKTPMPDTLYVGPEYSPENGNVNPADLRAMFGIKVRDYRNHASATPPTLTVAKNPDGTFTLTYTGTLVSSPTLKATDFAPVSGASSPWTINPKATGANPVQFYRAQQ